MKPSQLFDLLVQSIPNQIPYLIIGPPGIGKTDIVKQACAACEADVLVSHPVVSDPTDYKGLPFFIDGHAKFVPFNDLEKLIHVDKPTVFFADDIGQAPVAVQAALMQLIHGRRVNGHGVSDQVTFIAASNRKQDKAGIVSMIEPLKSRFNGILELETDLDDWVGWAIQHGVSPFTVGFMRFRPDLLCQFEATNDFTNTPTPRTIAHLDRLYQLNVPKKMRLEVYTGAVGNGFATEYFNFEKFWEEVVDPDLVLKDPENVTIPEELSTLYALCAAVAYRVDDTTAENFFTFANRLDPEFSVCIVHYG